MKGEFIMDFGNVSAQPVLNLKKSDVLDLTKTGSSLKKLILGAGWDVPEMGASYDLDIAAFLLSSNGRVKNPKKDVVYFHQLEQQGIYLNGDNRTGAGDGDDERIFIDTEQLKPEVERIVFVVTIFEAASKEQVFGKVKNAYVRLLDQEDGKEYCVSFHLPQMLPRIRQSFSVS